MCIRDSIKVEMPKVGDDTRYLANAVEGYSTQFMWNNRGKKSITVNMKDPEGVAALLELGKKVDVVLETMKPGSMKKMGLDYEAFKAVNPSIIYCACLLYTSIKLQAALAHTVYARKVRVCLVFHLFIPLFVILTAGILRLKKAAVK